MSSETITFTILSDFFVNLSTGWFGAIFVTTYMAGAENRYSVYNILLNSINTMVSLEMAVIIRLIAT